jgi:DNA mismatch repair ATPase MutS
VSTPIRNQYLRLKAQFPGAIMFFRLGDFYEMFDDDALTGSRELELTLTSREFARGERSPMCGVPYHAAENHIARLVARGYKVAICEQIGDPRTAKGLVEREVVRVVTPGTTVEPALLDPRRNRYLAAAILKGEEAGVAYADVTTGEISTMALRGRPVEALVERELVRVAPSEILWPQSDGGGEPPVAVPDAFVTPFAPAPCWPIWRRRSALCCPSCVRSPCTRPRTTWSSTGRRGATSISTRPRAPEGARVAVAAD